MKYPGVKRFGILLSSIILMLILSKACLYLTWHPPPSLILPLKEFGAYVLVHGVLLFYFIWLVTRRNFGPPKSKLDKFMRHKISGLILLAIFFSCVFITERTEIEMVRSLFYFSTIFWLTASIISTVKGFYGESLQNISFYRFRIWDWIAVAMLSLFGIYIILIIITFQLIG